MASLTETAFIARRTINWAIVAVIAYILLRIFWSIFITVFLLIFPPKAPPPNHAFGKLPTLVFPQAATPSAKLTFQLQTIEGTVPKASVSATVYFMPKTAPNLLGLNKAQDFAASLNFDPTPVQENKNIYRFNDAELPLRRLRYDIVSNNFIIRYAFEQDPSIFTEKNLPLPETGTTDAINLLQSHNLYPDDLAGGTNETNFLRLSGTQLVGTTSLSQADAERIDFFRKPIGDTPVFTPYADQAPISIIFCGSSNGKKRIIQFAYTFWPIDYQTTATYGLKTSNQAWEELQSGGGYIARYPSTGNIAVVRNVYLAYYDSFDPQMYLQPIFVFDGDNGFRAYLPAVTPPWTE
ncbi:MAG: hypothetical protein NTY06_00645 [Candidatus Gottesmanbacteria bacterium]|nr:hypothetical protein [Candidatus Gottesmanbacteria bacterium]